MFFLTKVGVILADNMKRIFKFNCGYITFLSLLTLFILMSVLLAISLETLLETSIKINLIREMRFFYALEGGLHYALSQIKGKEELFEQPIIITILDHEVLITIEKIDDQYLVSASLANQSIKTELKLIAALMLESSFFTNAVQSQKSIEVLLDNDVVLGGVSAQKNLIIDSHKITNIKKNSYFFAGKHLLVSESVSYCADQIREFSSSQQPLINWDELYAIAKKQGNIFLDTFNADLIIPPQQVYYFKKDLVIDNQLLKAFTDAIIVVEGALTINKPIWEVENNLALIVKGDIFMRGPLQYQGLIYSDGEIFLEQINSIKGFVFSCDNIFIENFEKIEIDNKVRKWTKAQRIIVPTSLRVSLWEKIW